jgi:hypothetical protein
MIWERVGSTLAVNNHAYLPGMGSTVASSVASSVGPLADLTYRPTNSLNKSVLSESTASAIASKLSASEIKGKIPIRRSAGI